MKVLNALEEKDLREFEPEAKIGLLATINPQGLPHLTLLSSLRAKTTTRLMFGQFSEGLSKKHVLANPQTGWLVLTMDRKLWRGKARWTHALHKTGEDFEAYNDTPMFRYNAYFGIHTVHYLDLVETYGREKMPLLSIGLGNLLTKMGRSVPRDEERILIPWAESLYNRFSAVKFIAYVGEDGFPVIIPLLQCLAEGSRRLVFSSLAYRRELSLMKPGHKAAVFAMSLDMEDVLVRGDFTGFIRSRGVEVGRIEIDWVYNSMPPKQGQVYPRPVLEPVGGGFISHQIYS
ncbi:MAG: pyridoxamine 5'-phosphate oxidase family protein [Thermodesulfobacteriota bacterium]